MTSEIVAFRERHDHLKLALYGETKRVQAILPRRSGLTPERLFGIVLDACARTPALLECEQTSIVQAVLQAAEVGLELASPLGEAYLVPFWDGKAGCKKAQFIAGYKGLVKLAHNSPKVISVETVIVLRGDEFAVTRGTNASIVHIPGAADETVENVVAAYAVAHLKHGAVQFDVMRRDKLDALRARSKSKGRDGKEMGPWATDTIEMFKKCPLRRLSKMLPLTATAQRAIGYDEEIEPIGEQRSGFENGRVDALKAKLNGPLLLEDGK
jgi:recombination protein RecT